MSSASSKKNKNRLLQNMIYAFIAQGVSLFFSIVMSLVVPKVLGVEEYSYWQLFIFYAGYVGFFHFGLNDGIYLRTGGMEYSELDHSLLGMQYKLSIIFESILAIIIILVSNFFIDSNERQFIIFSTAIYMILSNAALFQGYIFQAVNQTKIYSISVMLDRIMVLLSIIILMVLKVNTFKPFVFSYVLSKLVALLYCSVKGKKIILTRVCKIKFALSEMWINASVGIKLTVANIASMLILGCGRLVIDAVWGVEAFGRFSLSLSLTNFFLLFIAQISMVLFPALRQLQEEEQKEIYVNVRDAVGFILPLAFVAYVPLKELLGIWLPQYKDSLRYLVLLLPLCTFDGKMQLLCNTYFKVLRKEKVLLRNNIIAFAISFSLSVIGGYVVHDIYFIIISMVFAIAFRSIISELYLARTLEIAILNSLIQEIIMVVIFMVSAWYLPSLPAFCVILIAYGLYLIFNYTKLKFFLEKIKLLLRSKVRNVR